MNEFDSRKGNIVIGAMLVLVGAVLVLDRSGALPWTGMWSLWPLILGGIGLAKFVQSPPGEPKQGLVFMTAAAFLLVGEAGWISIEDSWPLLVIAIGLIIAFNGGRRRPWPPVPQTPGEPVDPSRPWRKRRRHERTLAPLSVIGIWIAVLVALQVSGMRPGFRSFGDSGSSDRIRVISVMGRAEHTSRGAAFLGADVTNVMGGSELDLREATLAPGASSTLRVFSMMGSVVVRVPPTWTVETGAVSALGAVRDERRAPEPDAQAGPAPRLVLRGLVMFGRMTITS